MDKNKVVNDVLNSFIGGGKNHKFSDFEKPQNSRFPENTKLRFSEESATASQNETENHKITNSEEEKITNLATSESREIKISENTEESGNKRRVWLLLGDKEKMFCKRMARDLFEDDIITGWTYSDYIEHLIKQEMNKHKGE